MTSWTRTQAALVEDLWPTHTAIQIASILNHKYGTSYTRNAIIGKVNRMGLEKATKPSVPRLAKVRTERRVPPPKPVRVRIMDMAPRIFVPSSAWEPLPDTQPISLVDLKSTTCRWPIDVADSSHQMFCGAGAETLYCPTHHYIGKSKAPPRPLPRIRF